MECLFLTAPHTIFFKSVEVERQLSSKKTADTGQLSVSRSIVVMARGSQGWRKSTFWSQSLTNGICTNTSINWDSKILTVAYRSSVELFLETIPYYIHQVWKEKPKDLLQGYNPGCTSQQTREQVWRCVSGWECKGGLDNKKLRKVFNLVKPKIFICEKKSKPMIEKPAIQQQEDFFS